MQVDWWHDEAVWQATGGMQQASGVHQANYYGQAVQGPCQTNQWQVREVATVWKLCHTVWSFHFAVLGRALWTVMEDKCVCSTISVCMCVHYTAGLLVFFIYPCVAVPITRDFSPIMVPLQSSLTVTLPDNNASHLRHNPFPGVQPTIVRFQDKVCSVQCMY